MKTPKWTKRDNNRFNFLLEKLHAEGLSDQDEAELLALTQKQDQYMDFLSDGQHN